MVDILFFHNVPWWIIAIVGAGVFLLVVLITWFCVRCTRIRRHRQSIAYANQLMAQEIESMSPRDSEELNNSEGK